MAAPCIARLDSRAAVAVSGEGWRSFLQGLLSQDVESLADGETRFGALLTPQGRVIHDLFIHGRPDGCLLDVARAGRDDLIQRLTLYRLRAKVEIAPFDAASVWAAWPNAFGEGWREDPRLPALGSRAYRVTEPETANATEADYDAHCRELGAPGPADWADGSIYPIEANFDLLNGVDFKKGCFVGQETTSRMKRRGQIKNRMLPIASEGPAPAAGSEVLAGDLRAGEVRSSGARLAMALLRLDRIDGPLTVDGRTVHVEKPAWMG